MLHTSASFRILRGGRTRLRERSSLVFGSKIWFRHKSNAASVPSEEPQFKIKRKYVPKDERRAMVESSVNKYRSKNLGTFPTASYVMKEVGGSYYVVKKMVQELEYNSKLSSSNKGVETQAVSIRADNELSEEITKDIVAGDVSKNVDTETRFVTGEVEEIATSASMKSKDFEDKATCEILLDIDGSNSKVEVKLPLPKLSLPMKPADIEQETFCESVDCDGSKSKAEPHPSPENLVPKKPEDTEERERYESLPDIDSRKSKSEVHQPSPEFSSAREPEDVNEETLSGSVLGFGGLESKGEEHQASPEYSISVKPVNTIEEEPCQTVPVVDGSKSNIEFQQPLTEISCAKKPEEEPYQTVAIDDSQSKIEEQEKSESESTEKQTEENQMKKSFWGNLKSVAEGILSRWRKQ